MPTARTWDYIAKQRMPLQPRVAEVVFLFVVTWLLMGQVIKPTDAENLNGYYQSKTVARVLLRSLASHREGRTYAYCTVVTWAVVTVLQGTVLPAYIVLLISTTYFTTISGETLQDMAKFYLIFAFVVNINTQALSMLQFFTCLDRSQTEYSSKYIRGHRVKKEVRAMTFVYGWFTGIVCAVSLIAFHFTFSLLWLWQIPISMLVFEVMQSSFAPCLFGWPACPVGTASCLYATWSLTTLACILLFVYKHACFLFPCLCAPEIPGWMFFPPRNDLWSPLRGAYDYDLSFYDAPLCVRRRPPFFRKPSRPPPPASPLPGAVCAYFARCGRPTTPAPARRSQVEPTPVLLGLRARGMQVGADRRRAQGAGLHVAVFSTAGRRARRMLALYRRRVFGPVGAIGRLGHRIHQMGLGRLIGI